MFVFIDQPLESALKFLWGRQRIQWHTGLLKNWFISYFISYIYKLQNLYIHFEKLCVQRI